MDKLKIEMRNKANENFVKLAVLFPNTVTEIIGENGNIVVLLVKMKVSQH